MYLRRLASHEVELHREIRLRALSEASEFLGETFADAAAKPAYFWDELTYSVSRPGGDVMYLAMEGKHVFGSIYGLLNGELSETGRLRGMWVDPIWRGKGVGRALLQEVFSWAREVGLNHLELWAPTHSVAANALYVHAGFRKTGNIAPLPTNSSLQIVEMAVQL